MILGRVPWTCLDTLVDFSGRYLFLKGMIGGVKVTLGTLYAPNIQQDLFLSNTFQEFTEGKLIIGGNFNFSLIPSIDTSLGTSSVYPGSRKRNSQALHRAQLVEKWLLLHSGKRDYFCPHKLHSHIGYFLIPHRQLHMVAETSIGHIT